jgi:hypothetical protein
MKAARRIALGLIVGAAIGGVISGAWASRPYTSTAVLRFLLPSIPDHFVRTHETLELDRLVTLMSQPVFSRQNLTRTIERYNLYPTERAHLPTYDVVDKMRPAIRIGPREDNTIRVEFTYSDPLLAQKVAANIVSSLVTEYYRIRTDRAALTLQFMQDRAELAGVDFEERLAKLNAAAAGSLPRERLKLAVEIARRQYEDLSQKRAEAEMLHALERRQQGATLDVLDPASIPKDWRPSPVSFSVATAIAGGVIALLLPFARRVWDMRASSPVTASARG